MAKKLVSLFLITFFLLNVIFTSKTYAVTDRQMQVLQAIADFAIDVCNNHESDFGYSFYFRKDGEIEQDAGPSGARVRANRERDKIFWDCLSS